MIDAALGVIERGTGTSPTRFAEQPWLPNGPIPLTVTWIARGRAGESSPSDASSPATGDEVQT